MAEEGRREAPRLAARAQRRLRNLRLGGGSSSSSSLSPDVLAELADRGFPFAELAERGLASLSGEEPVNADTLAHEIGRIRKLDDLKTGRCPWYRNDLLSPRSRGELLAADVERLAQACAPSCIRYRDTPPALWSAADWAVMAAEQVAEPLFDMDEVRRQHTAQRSRFREDGFCVFEAVMTPDTQRKWTAALQECQRLNDSLLWADWATLDWAVLRPGGRSPAESLPESDRRAQTGTAGFLPQSSDVAGMRTLRRHVLPEYFPAGHVPYLMNVLTHPDMLALQALCLECTEADIFFGQNQLSSKKRGTPDIPGPESARGTGWHSHWTGGGTDGVGAPSPCADPDLYMRHNLQSLTLSYPRGFPTRRDGNLSVIPGSHLYRDPDNCNGRMVDEAGDALPSGWLHGKCHPLKGTPLAPHEFLLRPGSLVCMNSHVAHNVGSVGTERPDRLALSSFYFRRSMLTNQVQPPAWLPPVWALKAELGQLPAALTRLLRNATDGGLTGGRCTMQQP